MSKGFWKMCMSVLARAEKKCGWMSFKISGMKLIIKAYSNNTSLVQITEEVVFKSPVEKQVAEQWLGENFKWNQGAMRWEYKFN